MPDVRLRVQVKGLTDPSELSVKLNEVALTGGTISDQWLEYAVAPSLVKRGANRFQITLHPNSEAKPVLQDLLLWVRYPKAP